MWHISSSFDRKAKFLSTFWFQLITFTTHYKCANWRDVVVFTWLLNYNFSPVSCSLDNSNTIYYLEVTEAVHISPALFFTSVIFCQNWSYANDWSQTITLYEIEMINFSLNISFCVFELMLTKSSSLLCKVSLYILWIITNHQKSWLLQ